MRTIARAFCGSIVLTLTTCSSGVQTIEPLGKKPDHVWFGANSVPNEQAIRRKIWAPGIDDGFVPQGLTWGGGSVFVSAYRSTNPRVDRGPCRIFRIDPESGATQGQLDLPSDCGHAGGLTYAGENNLIAADTRRLYRIDAATAFSGQNQAEAIRSTVKLTGELKGSFIDFDGSSLFLGSSESDAAKAKGHFLPLSVFETHRGGTIDEAAALRTIPLPRLAQGAAFDRSGHLWISASNSKAGALYRLDVQMGKVLAEYAMVIGIEDLGFDESGKLWAVSEAGSLRWRDWSWTFPVVFQMEVSRLAAQ